MTVVTTDETDFSIGPSAIYAYSRLPYTMWYALAEFIDNSTQSRLNHGGIIDDVLKEEGTTLEVDIVYNKLQRELSIRDNSIGMTKEDLIAALKIAQPTPDSKGRSKYGMGLKTASCWIGRKWTVTTCEWSKGEEWTATVDVEAIAKRGGKIKLSMRPVSTDEHYTKVVISELHRNIQTRTEETIRAYLGSMYRFDLQDGSLKLLFNNTEVVPPEDLPFDTDPDGHPLRRDLPQFDIDGKKVRGWFGVLRSGGRKYGGFSIFQDKRQILGFPNAWKPKTIYGGIDDEGANNLVAQRLIGVLELEGFEVSHTKDAVQWEGDEEEKLEEFLLREVREYREFARKRRGARGQPWKREKVKDLIESMKGEFTSPELRDAIVQTRLPPLEALQKTNLQLVRTVSVEDTLTTFNVSSDFRVVVSLVETSEFEPYVVFAPGAEGGTVHVRINGLHPYYCALESAEAIDECLRQYIYDAVAEHTVSLQESRINPDSVRRMKNDLLVSRVHQQDNAAAAVTAEAEAALQDGMPPA